MGLGKYKKKRDFSRTPEPAGRVNHAGAQLAYVIQKHDASRLHYDFRLELDGVLKSWAVPKGPSLDPARKALAVQVEDHPVEYGDFEGVIPKGNYGGGTVLLWDQGTWEPVGDARAGLKAGKLHFVLHGEKLQGEWGLVRMHGKAGDDGKNWLLFKVKDDHADVRRDVLADLPKSVKTKRSLDEIAGSRDDVWSGDAKKVGKTPGAIKGALPNQLSPQLAVLADAPPQGERWIHEIKFDGYRLLAHVKSGDVHLMTRNGHDWTAKFSGIAASIAKLKVDSAIIDGEAVVLDSKGRSDFQSLQAMLKSGEKAKPIFMAFDLPFCNGFDLRQTPLIERKKQLKKILDADRAGKVIRYSDHVLGHGDELVEKACRMDLEGIISKQADSPYVSRREGTWLKSKCVQRQEFVVVGYTPPQGSRTGFGSLLVGYHDGDGKLVYAGRVGTGFDEPLLNKTFKHLESIGQDKAPTAEPPPRRERSHAHWVKPTLVAEIKFTSWTRDGMLRHPVFVAFRSDKPAAQIVRESPVKAEQVEKKIAKVGKRKKSDKPKPKAARARSTSSSDDRSSVAGVTLSHPDKMLYPDAKITKADVANYYDLAARWMLPHVIERPLALVRCPGGVAAKCFFQRNWTDTLANDIDKVDVGQGKQHEYHVMVGNLAGVISLAQMGVLEIHAWNCRREDIEHPDQLIFDLDPGPDLPWRKVIDAARRVKAVLDSVGLPAFLKTSGGKGLHICSPIEPTVDWDSAKAFTATIAKSLEQTDKLFVANMRKDLRGGKVYLDYNRNGRSATAVAPYSTRARAGAGVAMPISWEELGKLKSADHFTVGTVSRYLQQRKTDPWRDFGKSRVDLRKILSRKSAA